MTDYKCDTCLKVFNSKQAYNYHITKKNPCIKKTQCKLCNKDFCSVFSMNRHFKLCKQQTNKKKPNINVNNETNLNNKLDGDHNKLKINNGINTNNININELIKEDTNKIDRNTLMIYRPIEIINNDKIMKNPINAHSNTDFDFITDDKFKEFIYSGLNCIKEFVKYLHANPIKTINHNIYIPNLRDLRLVLFNGQTWINISDKEEISEKMDFIFDDLHFILREKYYGFVRNKNINMRRASGFRKYLRNIGDKAFEDEDNEEEEEEEDEEDEEEEEDKKEEKEDKFDFKSKETFYNNLYAIYTSQIKNILYQYNEMIQQTKKSRNQEVRKKKS